MDYLNGYIWIVPSIIFVVAVIKVLTLIVKKKETENKPAHANEVLTSHQTVQSPTPAIASPEETGVMVYFANDNHNQRDKEYRFNYKKVSGSWRAYIIKMPSLGNRDSSGAVTHRLYDNGNPYVCWDSPVATLRDMQAISKVWADSIQEYIATGKRFG